jgi:8-oxo-dGTP pyrophosphatase MutT (NUDIX family)
MPNQQPTITGTSGREFAGSAAALLAFIVNEDERLLMLSAPDSAYWQVVGGALNSGETVLDGTLREIREEAGPVQVRPLGVFHAYTFPYDDNVQYLLCVCTLFAYEGGTIVPGDDMAGSTVRWFSADELENGIYPNVIPSQMPWIFRRAIELFRLWKNQSPVELQPTFENPNRRRSKDN